MNPFAISGLLIGITCTALILLIITKGRNKLHWIFGLHWFCVAIWGYGSFLIALSTNLKIAYVLWRIAYPAVVCIPIFFLHTVLILCKKENKILLTFAYLQGLFFSFLDTKGLVWGPLKLVCGSFYFHQIAWLSFISFFIWLNLVIYGHYLLLRFYMEIERDNRKQSFYFFIAALVGFIGGTTNFFPTFNINFYPYGNFGIPCYLIFIAYAILKHQFLDINIVFRKGLVYSIIIALITSIYLILVIIAEKVFQGTIGYHSLGVSLISAFIIALIFNPLRDKIQSFIDRIFLGKTPQQIARENELLRQEVMCSEKLKAVAAFASGMAHEIKNPLTAIKTFAEFLPQKLDDKEFLSKFSKLISSETVRVDNLVHQLLDFSKPKPLELKETDIHKLLDDVLGLLNSQFVKHKVEVIKDFNADKRILHADGRRLTEEENLRESALDSRESLPDRQAGVLKIKVDSNQIKQVFLNLFLNAIDAMPSGGTLTVSTCIRGNSTEISGNSCIEISVKDSGCGISQKSLVHIFEPFYTTKEKGTGLGLLIVHNIIKEHKGSIKVESKIGEGTRFIISLPLHKNVDEN